MKKILSMVNSEDVRRVLKEISLELNISLDFTNKLTDFFYNLEENEYQVLIIENYSHNIDILKIIQIAKKIRPRIPQIIISDDSDKQLMGLIHQEGIFYKCVPPIDKVIMQKTLQSSLDFFQKKNELNL